MKCQEEEEDLEAAAAALLLLRNRSSPDRPPSAENHRRSADQQPKAMGFKKIPLSFFLPPWGIRSRRSSCGCRSKRAREEDDSSAAACNRPSPATPLDFGAVSSDPSTSGSDGFHTSSENKRLCADGDASAFASASRSVVDTKVSAVLRSPLVEAAVTTSKPIRRQGRKKTMSELQVQERSLMEEKTMLMKLVESRRKDMETLIAENQRLKSVMTIFQRARAATEAAKPAFLLPDLNEPVLMESLET